MSGNESIEIKPITKSAIKPEKNWDQVITLAEPYLLAKKLYTRGNRKAGNRASTKTIANPVPKPKFFERKVDTGTNERYDPNKVRVLI
jgi:hypothetical protein